MSFKLKATEMRYFLHSQVINFMQRDAETRQDLGTRTQSRACVSDSLLCLHPARPSTQNIVDCVLQRWSEPHYPAYQQNNNENPSCSFGDCKRRSQQEMRWFTEQYTEATYIMRVHKAKRQTTQRVASLPWWFASGACCAECTCDGQDIKSSGTERSGLTESASLII